MTFGTVGTNFISKEFIKAGQGIDGFSVGMVYSRTIPNAHAFGGLCGCEKITDDINRLAESDVDAVYIASPNKLHFEQAKLMLEHGKHVLLEKPACPNREDFARLLDIAEERELVLLEAMRPAFTPGFMALKQAVGTIGTIRRASLSYCQYSSRYDKFKDGIIENAFDPTLCNGALMDIGIYCVHCLASLFGMPESIHAVSQKLWNGLDAQGGALCAYPGFIADISYSKIADSRRQSEIQGELGTILTDSITNPKRIMRVNRDKSEEALFYDPDTEFFGMKHEIMAFMGYIGAAKRGERPWHKHNRTTETGLRIADEIRLQTGIDFRFTGETAK